LFLLCHKNLKILTYEPKPLIFVQNCGFLALFCPFWNSIEKFSRVGRTIPWFTIDFSRDSRLKGQTSMRSRFYEQYLEWALPCKHAAWLVEDTI
jgi:hypothetical protein